MSRGDFEYLALEMVFKMVGLCVPFRGCVWLKVRGLKDLQADLKALQQLQAGKSKENPVEEDEKE